MPPEINIPELPDTVYNSLAAVRRGAFKLDQHHVHFCASGDRYPVYVDGSGIINVELCTYMAAVRRMTPSVNTRLQKLRGAMAIGRYAAHLGFSLTDRVRSGSFLFVGEQLGFDDYLYATTGAGPKTRALRHNDGLGYMRFSWRRHASSLADDAVARLHYLALCNEFKEEFRGIIPRADTSGPNRMGLSPAGVAALACFLADPTTSASVWPNRFVSARNRLLLLCFVLLGHRVGEFLSLCCGDLDLSRRLYRIRRRHNSALDLRTMQPLTKGRERELRWPALLVPATQTYIAERGRRPLASGHDFMFVSDIGEPMSRSLVTKVFDDVRASLPDFDEPLTPHILRHTWNDLFTEAADRGGLGNEAEIRARMLAAGWKTRGIAETYTRRGNMQAVDRISMGIQSMLFETSGGAL